LASSSNFLTTIQDYTLFHSLNMRSIGRILAKNGLLRVIVHPDYDQEPDTQTVYEG
jgi:hypothetical protein